jgi:hypothetical protein
MVFEAGGGDGAAAEGGGQGGRGDVDEVVLAVEELLEERKFATAGGIDEGNFHGSLAYGLELRMFLRVRCPAMGVRGKGAGGRGRREVPGLSGRELEEGGEAKAVSRNEMADLPGEGDEGGLGDMESEFAVRNGGVEAHDPGGGALVDAVVVGHDDDFFPGFEAFDRGAECAGLGAIPGQEVEGEIGGLFFEPLAACEAEAAMGIVEDVEGAGDLMGRCAGWCVHDELV